MLLLNVINDGTEVFGTICVSLNYLAIDLEGSGAGRGLPKICDGLLGFEDVQDQKFIQVRGWILTSAVVCIRHQQEPGRSQSFEDLLLRLF